MQLAGAAPVVTDLAWTVDAQDPAATTGYLSGFVTDDGLGDPSISVEVDVHADGTVDHWIYGDANSTFDEWLELPYGQFDVAVRGSQWDSSTGEEIFGSWTTLAIDNPIPQNDPPQVANLAWTPDYQDASGVTGYLSGDVTDDGVGDPYYGVQFDLREDGDPDIDFDTDAYGSTFDEYLSLPFGEYEVHARAYQWDEFQQANVYGDWAIVIVDLVRPESQDDTEYWTIDELVLEVDSTNGILANDVDDDPLEALLESGPENGSVTLNADGSFTYTANEGFSGLDTFTYRAFDGVLFGATTTVQVAVSKIELKSWVPNGWNAQDVLTFDKVDVDENTWMEYWVGERRAIEAVETPPPGQESKVAGYQWTIPGDPYDNFVVGPDGRTGHRTELHESHFEYPGLFFRWSEGSVAGTDRIVTVEITLEDGRTLERFARYKVFAPQVSLIVDSYGDINANPTPLGHSYEFGLHPVEAGITAEATQLDGAAGEFEWWSLMDWQVHGYFPNDAPVGTPAGSQVGAGEYSISLQGMDDRFPTAVGDEFTDSPRIQLITVDAAEGGYVEFSASWSTYLMWWSDEPGAESVPLRRIDWGFSFRVEAIENDNVPGGWSWGPPLNTTYHLNSAIDAVHPEWNYLILQSQLNQWSPIG